MTRVFALPSRPTPPAALLLLAWLGTGCGEGAAGPSPQPYGYVPEAGARPGSFDPSARAGVGRQAPGAPTPPDARTAPADGGGDFATRGSAGSIGTAGSSTGTAGGGGVQTPGNIGGSGTPAAGPGTGTFQCGTLLCTTDQFCLVQLNISPNLVPAAECLLVPANCTSCECVKPLLSCHCSPVPGGGLMVSCP